MTTSTSTKQQEEELLPKELVDAHHHFVDTVHNDFQKNFLGSLIPDTQYSPEQYHQDVVMELQPIRFVGSVHVECLPDNGVDEVRWVDSLSKNSNNSCHVKAIVASCDLTSDTVDEELLKLTTASTMVKGIRWILDVDEESEGATHVATTRHANGVVDYLRPQVLPKFERGYALLAKYDLSFDLQCAPAQLVQAAKLCANYPNIPVCINHMGKPNAIIVNKNNNDDDQFQVNEKDIETWRVGMRAMAALPHVYCKISMLGYAVPGWIRNEQGKMLLKQLVLETLDMFGPQRCMVALNWYMDGATSDADGKSEVGPSPMEFVNMCATTFFQHLSQQDRQGLFCNNARAFYRF